MCHARRPLTCINVQNAGSASWLRGKAAKIAGFWDVISIQNATTPHSLTEPSKAIRVRYAKGASNLSRHFSNEKNSQFRVDKLAYV